MKVLMPLHLQRIKPKMLKPPIKKVTDLNLISLESGKLIREKLLNDKEIISYASALEH